MRTRLYNTRTMTGSRSAYRFRENKVWTFISYFSIVVFIAAGIFLLTWKEIYGMRLGYDIQEKEKEVKELLDENQMFKMKLINLASLEKIENQAIDKMKLKKPHLSQIKIVE